MFDTVSFGGGREGRAVVGWLCVKSGRVEGRQGVGGCDVM